MGETGEDSPVEDYMYAYLTDAGCTLTTILNFSPFMFSVTVPLDSLSFFLQVP